MATDDAGWTAMPVAVVQASGMVGEQLGCTPEVALIVMRKRAESDACTVDDIADAVLARDLRFT